ncbi:MULTISPECIES: hypothetical protein [unclassified Sphingomonas]|uniref:hypothetical protein n=1 Tax=unclassified Sphingomonas TaxID=196159 RepID=UPI0012E33287|nr:MULTISPECIES: hypothetical protein [unclassified Sphingomonas]
MSALKWAGLVVGITVLSIAGFIFAAWLSPGDPGRSYLNFALVAAAASLAWRLIARLWSCGLSNT